MIASTIIGGSVECFRTARGPETSDSLNGARFVRIHSMNLRERRGS